MGRHVSTAAKFALSASLAFATLAGGQAEAEPVTDHILSHYQLFNKNGCMLLKINFNIRVRYVSHFPVGHGNQLNIVVRPIDQAPAGFVTAREAMRTPESNPAGIQAITFEPHASQGAVLQLSFRDTIGFNIAPGNDFQSMIIALGDPRTGRVCRAEDPNRPAWETNVQSQDGETVVSRRKVGRGGETVIARRDTRPQEVQPAPMPAWETSLSEDSVPSAAESGEPVAKGVEQARIAMRKGDMTTAIAILKKADGPEATELLGVAYQKNKQIDEAKATYQAYLRKYGNGEGAEGVRQRLAGIETATADPNSSLRGGNREGTGPGRSYWSVSGSISEFYVRDDSFQKTRDPTQPLNLNDTADDHQVHRNTLMSSVDLFAAWGNEHYKSKFRFSGGEEHNFDDGGEDIVSVSALYYDTTIKDWGTSARVGRQTHSGDGVLGRFDGVFASWQANPWFRLSAVGGSPAQSRKDEPFKDERYFYGASVNFGPVFGGFDATIFAIQAMNQDMLDRQAVGTELRYVDANKSAFITVDYDTHFNELNAAIFSGSWTFGDKSTLRAGADYRKAPYLTTWNALQGTTYTTLYDMLKANITKDQIDQLALDRTPTYKSVTLGYTKQLNDKLQINLDATASHIDGTITSYINGTTIDGMPSTGNEFYYSGQLVGNNLLTEDDLWTAGIRYSDLHDSDNYAVDMSTRYALRKDLRISPRVIGTYRTGKTSDVEEYAVLPSVLMDYYWTKDLNLELEVGSRFTWRTEGMVETRDTEVFVTAGVRYDFYAGSDKLK